MVLDPFTMVEMRGMSIITATWIAFFIAGFALFAYWAVREFGRSEKKHDKHDDDICRLNMEVSSIIADVAVTRSIVERIDQNMSTKENRRTGK